MEEYQRVITDEEIDYNFNQLKNGVNDIVNVTNYNADIANHVFICVHDILILMLLILLIVTVNSIVDQYYNEKDIKEIKEDLKNLKQKNTTKSTCKNV
mgnify:CR=1 FL=1